MLTLKERFVTDADGKRVAVQLEIGDYYRLLEALRIADILRAPKATDLNEAEREAVRREAQAAAQALRAEAEQTGLNRLTEEEITAEIRAARAARRNANP